MFLGYSDYSPGRATVRLLNTGRIFATKNYTCENDVFPCIDKLYQQVTAPLRVEVKSETPLDAAGGELEAVGASRAIDAVGARESRILEVNEGEEKGSEERSIESKSSGDVNSESEGRPLRAREPTGKFLENLPDVNVPPEDPPSTNSMFLTHEPHYDSPSFNLAISSTVYPIPNPKNDKEARESKYADEFKKADVEEMEEIWRQGTYDLVPRPTGVRIIPSRFVRTIKWNLTSSGSNSSSFSVERFKSRWIACGYDLQGQFGNTYAFVVAIDLPSMKYLPLISKNFTSSG